jgi:hypothetical protein
MTWRNLFHRADADIIAEFAERVYAQPSLLNRVVHEVHDPRLFRLDELWKSQQG